MQSSLFLLFFQVISDDYTGMPRCAFLIKSKKFMLSQEFLKNLDIIISNRCKKQTKNTCTVIKIQCLHFCNFVI